MASTISSNNVKIPVIILNWNGLEDTARAIESVLNQKEVAKVVVVDNCSESKEAQELASMYADEPLIEIKINTKNLGFGKAHNAVFRQLHDEGYQWVACLNNDATADPNWLQHLSLKADHDKVFSVASMMLMASNPELIDSAGHKLISTGEIIPNGHGSVKKNFSTEEETIGACAGACLYNLQKLHELGYFDERFFVGYEDAEIGLRAWLCGFVNIYNPNAIVYHKMSTSIGKVRSSEYLATIQSDVFYTWFKLMPVSIILSQLIPMLFKYSTVFIIDIVFLRLKFLKVMGKGVFKFISGLKQLKYARSQFYAAQKVNRTFIEIYPQLTTFLFFDIKRFWHFVILNKKSNLEL